MGAMLIEPGWYRGEFVRPLYEGRTFFVLTAMHLPEIDDIHKWKDATILENLEKKNTRAGALAAIGACVLWGVLPIYWKLLSEATAYEIFTHRICWSFVFMLFVIGLSGRLSFAWQETKAVLSDRRRSLYLLGASLLISFNWLTYIWAVNHEHILESSMGYYINPLMNVGMGMLLFHEKLLPAKKLSLLLAAVGILHMTVNFGAVPWISLVLAVTFSGYGVFKKLAHIDPATSVALETLFVMPPAICYLCYLAGTGTAHFAVDGELTLLFIGAGAVTATPMVLFTKGANLLPLNVLGFLQYIQPTINFLVGVFVFHEAFGFTRLCSFAFIWLALIVFSLSERFSVHRSSVNEL